MDLEAAFEKVENSTALDRVGDQLAPLAAKVGGTGRRKDLLSGTWLGHPAHPMLVFAPLSCFFSASTLDLVGGAGGRRAARRLIGLGLLSALPAAAAGMADWSDTAGAERRTGTAHAMSNTAALALYALSWRQRIQGRTGRGVLTGLAGATMAGVGGYLGGHLTYRRGVGVDTTVFQAGPQDWRAIGSLDDLPEGRPLAVSVDDVALVVVRRGTTISVLEARCTHRGGPLHEGELSDGCITCPWHGSRFELATGAVARGPATAPAPAYEARMVGGQVEVRRQDPSVLRTRAVSPSAGEAR